MVYRSNSSTHLNSNDINNVLPIPTVNHKSLSFTNLTLPPPPTATDYDPGKQARRSVRRLSIDIERLRLKKDMTTVCTTRRRNSVCRSAIDLSKSGSLYDDLKSLKTQRNECVQKHKSDKIAVPCTTTTTTSSAAKFPSWLSEGLEPDPELEDKNLNRLQISVPLNRLPVTTVDFLLAIKNNQTIDKLKILCLYCDRTFSSQTLYAKHSERVHQAPEGRRLSARKTNSSSLLYPGCSHCHNGKTTSLLNEELPALFHHLIDIHFDKYFACKPCTVRFPSKEALQTHLDQLHKDTASKVSADKRKKRVERRVPDNVPANLSQPLTIQVDLPENFDDKKDEEKSSPDEPILRSSRRQHANRSDSTKTSNPRKTRMLRNEETILSRLGITQNRSPRTRRGLKTRAEVIRAETPIIRPTRNKITRSTNNSSGVMVEGIEMATRSSAVTKIESLSSTFDENFYESVSINVRQNLSCHLDGKMQSGPMSPSPISPVDPVPTVRSTLVRSPLVADSEIHEATAISALTAFPTLLTASQYGAEPMPMGKIKKPITKNSWKWKWDCVKKYKYVNEGGKVVKKVKQPVAGIRDLSKLDMWTQLTMRTKHEVVRKNELQVSGEESCLAVGEAAREDKRKLITQLNKILDARILPQINLEQNDQRVVKLEVEDTNAIDTEMQMKAEDEQPNDDLLTILQIAKKPVPASNNEEERVLSGEWARPRCYICYGCGEKFENNRRLEDHKNTFHPHVYSTHYEIVGKELIEGDLFRHFYIPTNALRGHSERLHLDRKSGNVEVEDSMDSMASFSISCSKSDSFDMDSNSRNSKVSAISISTSSVGNVDEASTNDVSAELKKSCTKCKRSYNTMAELYRHMLDCSGDYDWFLAKKRHNIKYRYFGSRRRKINRTNFGNRRPIRPKKEESDTPRIRDTQTPKPRPSDAESIQRMLENLPAKRVCRQIFPNLQAKKRVRKFMPVNSTLARSRQQMLTLKPANAKTNRNYKFIATTQTTVNAIRKNISRRLRYFAATNSSEVVRNTRSARTPNQTKQQSNEDTTEVAAKSHGVVKNITQRRTQRIFPKLPNPFRRPLQKRNLRNVTAETATVATDSNSGSLMDRIRKSKRVQVTLKKLDDNIVDLVQFDDRRKTDDDSQAAPEGAVDEKAPAKKQTIGTLIKSLRGKRAGSKKTIDNDDDVEAEVAVVETPTLDVKIEVDDLVAAEVKELPNQIDETSQSSSRSGSSRKSKRNAMKKQKSIECVTADAVQDENVGPSEETKEETKVDETSDIQPEIVTTEPPSEEPMDLSQSKSKLSVPVVSEPIKTPPMKRRTRKLNDCIAMLTGKLQEKLGVPFINSEATILLSPTKTDTPEIESKEHEKQEVVEAKTPAKPSKEPSSSHSTPTKRGSRSPKTKEQKTNVVVAMDPVNKVVVEVAQTNAQESVDTAAAHESHELSVSVNDEVTPPEIIEPLVKCTENTVVVATESTDDDRPLKAATPKRSASKLESVDAVQLKKLDETLPTTESQERDDKTIAKITSDNTATDTVKTPRKKEAKRKIVLEPAIPEPPFDDQTTVETTSNNTATDTVKTPKKKEAKRKIVPEETVPEPPFEDKITVQTTSDNTATDTVKIPKKKEAKRKILLDAAIPEAPFEDQTTVQTTSDNTATDTVKTPMKKEAKRKIVPEETVPEPPFEDKITVQTTSDNRATDTVKTPKKKEAKRKIVPEETIPEPPFEDKTTVETTSDNTATDTVKTPKKKEAKRKIIPEEIIPEPTVIEMSTVPQVPKKRQTKNSSPKSFDSPNGDKSSSTGALDEETKIKVPDEVLVETSKQKPVKAKGGKGNPKHLDVAEAKTNRRNSPKVAGSSPIEVEPPKNADENDEKPINEAEKNAMKGRKLKRKSGIAETKVATPTPLNDKSNSKNTNSSDDEMHPWDPEIGFITANNPEPASTPAVEPIPLSDPIDKTQLEPTTSSCNDSTNEPRTIPTAAKVTDEKIGTKKKRRKNELAKIIADQLLESFKEVDKSRIEELKLLHDLSIESNDDLLLSTTMSRTPTPKRRTATNIRNDTIVEPNTATDEVNGNENVDKSTSRRKKPIESKKSPPTTKLGKQKKKIVPSKSNKKDNKKKASDVPSSGYLSDTEVAQPKKPPVVLRRRLTICDESPKRMSRNSKETEVSVSLFDSFKKRKNIREISATKQTSKDTKIKPPSKVLKQKNKRNLLQQSSNDSKTNATNDDGEHVAAAVSAVVGVDVEKDPSDKDENNGKSKANVNDLVTQIINDFTTSTLNSPTTSPILFGDLSKPRLNNTAATKLSSVLSNKKNILNGETLTNGFKSDVSKEITFATLSQPLKDKTVEEIRNADSLSTDAKQPFRAPFMSPRWDPADEWNGTSKPHKDPAMHKLWTLNNKDEQLAGEKSLYQSVKEKTKKFLGKISRKKTRKHDGTLNNKKVTTPAVAIKRPLLRPSILSVSNHTSASKAVMDTVESENCLKKLETNRLFLGKISNFENDSVSKIFRNDKVEIGQEIAAESELFSKRSDTDTTIMSNLKSNVEKEDWKMDKKKFDGNSIPECKNLKNDCKPKRNVKKKQQKSVASDDVAAVTDAPKKTNVDKVMKRRKMGSTKRKTDNNSISLKNPSEDLNQAFCNRTESSITPAATKPPSDKTSATRSFDESSQDTIISEIVNKIRDSNNGHTSESDEDLSLAEIAKNLNNKIELSESFVGRNNFGSLVAALNDELDARTDEKTQDPTNCDVGDGDGEDGDDRNTDLIDMDLEDSASVYTSSMETTVTSSGGSPKRRKRRHGRSILMKPSRKSKRGDESFLTPGESFFCDLCSKTFRTQGGLATHRTTLMHISKLSEQEFKQKMETPNEIVAVAEEEPKPVAEEDVTTKPDVTKSPIIESSSSSSQPNVPFSQSPSSNQRNLSITSPARNQSLTYLNNIEPISSPEQHDFNYDRYTTTNSRPRNNAPSHDSSRIALSQEQRFFYECCSMLKGSDRSNVNPSDSPNKYYTLPERSEVITKPVTPRSNEQYSYVVPEGSKHSKGIPKIDLNQFSDISSDSNPAFSCPQNPSSSETQNIFPSESKRVTDTRDYHSTERNFDLIKKDGRTFNDRTTTHLESDYLETYSDMGDSFPSSQDVSESEQYSQTILERSSNAVGLIRGGYHDSSSTTMYGKTGDGNKQRRNVFTIAMESNEAKTFSNSSPVESPLHSTSSQSSTLSKPRTKAAMKGYDNFKISIPTTGIDLQQALNRSPNPSGCKLAALADIALGVPNVVGSHSDIDIEPSHTPIEDAPAESVPEAIAVHKQQVPKAAAITTKTATITTPTNKAGSSNRKKKTVSIKTPKKSSNKTNVKTSPKYTPKSQPPRDVYDFEDFDDSTDAPILTLSQVRSKPLPPSVNHDEEAEDSETSSYSDRLDFNYESMSESDTSVDNLQKKCLIEKIFKSVKKPDAKEKQKIEPKKPPLPKQELDKLFDGLRQNDKNTKIDEKKATTVKSSLSTNKPAEEKNRSERSRDRQSKKSREIANLEEEWGMSMNQIVELIGVGQRKTQRRCAANKQKTFAENWSSDEYEDFHATKDIFALIHEAEMKAGRARSRTARSNAKRERQQENEKIEQTDEGADNTKAKTSGAKDNKSDAKDKENKATADKNDKNEISTEVCAEKKLDSKKSEPSRRSHSKSTDSKVSPKKPAKVKRSKSFVATESDDDDSGDDTFDLKKNSSTAKPSKIKNRRQTISSRHDLHKAKAAASAMANGARVKPNRSIDSRVDFKSDGKMKTKQPMARRKRKASEMLYYWSSSSDEEFGRIKPRDDNFDDDNLEQHGWIVGDSHKKLVTLLAHAKGKKVDDCAVKKAIHKKKS